MAQINNWEEVLYNFLEQSLNAQTGLVQFIRPTIPFNSEQRRAVRAIRDPIENVPQNARSTQLPARISNVPPEQIHTFTDPGNNFHISRKVVASTLVIGPPGTGKTHVICSGSALRVFTPGNLLRARRDRGQPERVFIATFSNAGAYRIYEKFHEIASLANTPDYFERIKLVQSQYAQDSYSFQVLQQRLNLNPDDFIINNRMPSNTFIQQRDWNAILGEVLIFVGTTDSLSILTNDPRSNVRVRGVIYDEASQLTVPQFYQVIPTHTIQSICMIGDDKQLPPVSTLAPLGVSALSYLQGMNTYQNIPIPIDRRIELHRQYRMHPAIAQITERILPIARTVIPDAPTTSNDYVLPRTNYDLNNIPNLNQQTLNVLDEILKPDHPLVILDTSDIPQALDRTVGRSRINEREAEIALGVYYALGHAYQGLSNEDIILTAPYRPQVEIFMNHNVRTGTVHQYQGQEAEAVIYSLTFARPRTKSDFFTQFNLMYVGLSRAKRKLIIIGNQDAMNHPDRSIQNVRNTIFNFQYIHGGQGYPPYTTNPVARIRLDNAFLTDINNIII